MNSGSQLTIDGLTNSGTFSAVGTVAQPILLSGLFSTAGIWSSITFKGSASAANRLKYCIISSGGTNEAGNHGMINLTGTSSAPSHVDIRNCTISNSGTNGIYIQKNKVQYNTDIETANAGANVYYDVSHASGE